jgi:TonB family protein
VIFDDALWLWNLAAYSLQLAIIVIAGSSLVALLRIQVPKIRLAYWQALLAACISLPFIQPWRLPRPSGRDFGAISQVIHAAQPSPSSAWPVAGLAVGLLLGGILLRLLWNVLGIQRLRMYRKRACMFCLETPAVREAQALTGIRTKVYLSWEVAAPATFGLRFPAVLLPRSFLQLPAAHQKAIACHEFLHVARHDWAWMAAEELILTLLWFHPAIWWLVRNIRLSREQAVDVEVIRLTSRRTYVDALLSIAQRRIKVLPAAPFLTESQLVQRVAMIAKEVKMSRFRIAVSLLIAAAALCVVTTGAVRCFPLTASPLPSPATQPAPGRFPTAGSGLHSPGDGALPGGRICKVGKGISAPIPIRDHQPDYTPQARKAHLHGTAIFSVVVDAKGNVDAVRETGRPLGLGLDESAMKAIRNWQFKPGLRKGKPVPVRVVVEVTFRMF